jgi:hypothetical protein
MNLQVITIADRGIPSRERLHIVALANTDLSYYVTLLSIRSLDGRVASGLRAAYWFGPRAVKAGDTIILYSGPGQDTTEIRPDGGTNHFYHWGLKNTVWGPPTSCAVLIEIINWQTSV